MTPPALGVLTLALVCSIFGSASEQTADRASVHTTHHNTTDPIDLINTTEKMTRTNIQHNATKTKQEDIIQFDDIYIEDNLEVNMQAQDKYLATKQIYNENEEYLNKVKANGLKVLGNKHLNFGEARTSLRTFEERKSRWKAKGLLDSTRVLKRTKRDEMAAKCELFYYVEGKTKIHHPHNNLDKDKTYYSKVNCVTVIPAKAGQVVILTFVDVFHIEYHPKCEYDFLEIRDGQYGYAKLQGKYCGEAFPSRVRSEGPYLWLKFHSDDTIEYEGFTINIEFESDSTSLKIPDSCYHVLPTGNRNGTISTETINPDCLSGSKDSALDVLWTIETPENTSIYLNFTSYTLAKTNECEENVIQIFGQVLEYDSKIAHYCGSVANAVSTQKEGKPNTERTNLMYVHYFASRNARNSTKFSATYTAFRTLDPNKDEHCDDATEFNCQDNTCIDVLLRCDHYAHCRLKTDEDPETCVTTAESTLKEAHILSILIIFSLILSGMSFVFLFKCFRKLYQDHKIIKEHIKQSCEDGLDALSTLDPRQLRASEPRDNHTNELYKQQRSISQHKQSSIESDFQETHLDLDDEPWPRREVETIPEAHDIKVEPQRNGRTRRSDTSKKEESIRSRKESMEEREKKDIRDAAVGAPDTKESGCQTRESLFQTDPAPSSDGSNSNSHSRGFSTFGYSGATLVRPSPPPGAACSVQLELLRRGHEQDGGKAQKKIPDRRPMSSETTRSAPDVIIVSKPIR